MGCEFLRVDIGDSTQQFEFPGTAPSFIFRGLRTRSRRLRLHLWPRTAATGPVATRRRLPRAARAPSAELASEASLRRPRFGTSGWVKARVDH